uniref:Uncharacterized protein n=1 Tax=viral metagenome TaxID=1070528 RepID=A0A6M3LDB8_9ZZZZ
MTNYPLCNCHAYPYPHPEGMGDCHLPDSCDYYGDGCFTCEARDTCWLLPDGDDYDYDSRGEALTAQERNPDFRSW